MELSNERKQIWRLTLSKRDLRIMGFLAPVIWIMFAYGAYVALAAGRMGEGIAHIGMLIVLFCGLVGPYIWGVVTTADVALRKVLAMMTALGVLIAATGWVIRLAAYLAT